VDIELKQKRVAYYQITDPKTIDRILDGRTGVSIGVVVDESHCSICMKEPSQCEHIPGERYGEQIAQVVITRMTPRETSLVRVPENPHCRVTKLLVRVGYAMKRRSRLNYSIVRRKPAGDVLIEGIAATAG
jgi:hypothetical protein